MKKDIDTDSRTVIDNFLRGLRHDLKDDSSPQVTADIHMVHAKAIADPQAFLEQNGDLVRARVSSDRPKLPSRRR